MALPLRKRGRMTVFVRAPDNPILAPSELWWEAKGVLNPAVVRLQDQFTMIYRAVGADGVSRLGRAVSQDGIRFDRIPTAWAEVSPGDWNGRLGVEDPRVTFLESDCFLTFAKVGVEPASKPKLSWEPAPFHIRSWIGKVTGDFDRLEEIGPVLAEETTKDLVLFPQRIGGRYLALVRRYPSVQLVESPDLSSWRELGTVLEPIGGTWEAERVGAGPPPVRTESGWLLLYHANEFLQPRGNRRMYRMGMALLDEDDPGRVIYRHPEPVFEPEARYECQGPVGNVVFGTSLLEVGDKMWMYYGAGDGVIGLARARKEELLSLYERS